MLDHHTAVQSRFTADSFNTKTPVTVDSQGSFRTQTPESFRILSMCVVESKYFKYFVSHRLTRMKKLLRDSGDRGNQAIIGYYYY